MYSEVSESIGKRIVELEARLAELELQRDELDAHLAVLKKSDSFKDEEHLKFFPFSSKAETEFWKILGERKLNEYRLSDAPVRIFGAYSVTNGKSQNQSWIEVRASSFKYEDWDDHMFAHERKASGWLLNLNTLDQFKSINKKELLSKYASNLVENIESGQIFSNTSSTLTQFLVLTYADLKKHRYLYWFAFPAFSLQSEIQVISRNSLQENMPGFFESLSKVNFAEDQDISFFFVAADGKVESFSKWANKSAELKEYVIGFFDPSPFDKSPSWLLRNLLFFASHGKGLNIAGKRVKIICIRDIITPVSRPAEFSTVWEVVVPSSFNMESVTGWEPNFDGKIGPRLANLSEMLDESKLSETACNLNLRLMKWRAFPQLDENKLAQTRVLLLGSGTLGCAVARGLLGWGFRNFTFCDNGRVAYSNPVRQSLFVARDCSSPDNWKARIAAERCKEILPTVNTDYWIGSIPMPGHYGDPKQEEVDFLKVESLIEAHDVICLLTDTRESRWLPTLIGAANDKIVLNAALGFDTMVVMRHGSKNQSNRLGCYFCNDVVAPQDSTRDRTLDQQCTVTRPGGAPIAGAILVELLVGILHHPDEHRAPATDRGIGLGALPHQIRGFLGTFQNDIISGPSFPQCTACSDIVVEEYLSKRFEMVRQVLQDPNYLEQLTGLDKLKSQDLDDNDFFLDDDEEEEED